MFKKYLGPSTLVTAAFIGPGTVTVCTIAGVEYGYSLIWPLIFSIIATIILQEMAARIGLITQEGLGAAIRKERSNSILGFIMMILVLGAVLVGNAAYEAGNIGGGVLGMDLIAGDFSAWPLVLGGLSFLLLYFAKYKWVERFLIGLVLLISLSFLITAFLVNPSFIEILKGCIPSFSADTDWLRVIALIGTTVVPYNLFLQASLISKKYKKAVDLNEVKTENTIAIILGGVISILIVVVSAASSGEVANVSSAADLAIQLQPLLGDSAKYGIAIGLLAAGLSSAITAPLAAALVAREIFGWRKDDKDWKFKSVWMTILGIGIAFSMLGFKPIIIIQFAQVMNGLLLPIIAVYLLYLVNKKDLLHGYVNSNYQNILGGVVVLVTLLISGKTMLSLF